MLCVLWVSFSIIPKHNSCVNHFSRTLHFFLFLFFSFLFFMLLCRKPYQFSLQHIITNQLNIFLIFENCQPTLTKVQVHFTSNFGILATPEFLELSCYLYIIQTYGRDSAVVSQHMRQHGHLNLKLNFMNNLKDLIFGNALTF